LDFEYIDLYLIHWPGTAKLDPSHPLNAQNRRESWKALEECVRSGKLKSIGVSNYTLRHLKEMEEYSTIKPAVHQFEVHPAHVQKDVIDYCQDQGIFIQTYASLAEGALLDPEFLKYNLEFNLMAQKYKCTVPQILLKWPLQHAWGIIPKSINPGRIQENIDLNHFEICKDDMLILDNFNEKVSFKKCWNSQNVI
jgi:methylglyoxal/glyoxal reductase